VSPVALAPIKLLFAGRLTDQKGLPFLFSALGELSKLTDLPPWSLTLVGDGPEKNTLAELARTLQIADRINFAGWLSRAELSETYRQHDVFVLPSLDEGMPNVLLEAMASGLPSVVTKISGNEELVREGKNGFLVPPRDVRALAEALTRMLQKKDLRIQLGDAAREIAVEYSWRSVAEKYLTLARDTRHPL
jgi:glycosyltransferase involved in cell wall biosynthesis